MSKGSYGLSENDDYVNINSAQRLFSKKGLLDNDNITDTLSLIENNYEMEKTKRKKGRKKTLKQKKSKKGIL